MLTKREVLHEIERWMKDPAQHGCYGGPAYHPFAKGSKKSTGADGDGADVGDIGKILKIFKRNHINGEALYALSQEEMIAMGITSLGIRKFFLRCIDHHRREANDKNQLTAVHPLLDEERQLDIANVRERRAAYEAMSIVAALVGAASVALVVEVKQSGMDGAHVAVVFMALTLGSVSMAANFFATTVLTTQVYFLARLAALDTQSADVSNRFMSISSTTRHLAVKATVYSLPVFLVAFAFFVFAAGDDYWFGGVPAAIVCLAAGGVSFGIYQSGEAYFEAYRRTLVGPRDSSQRAAHIIF